MATTLDVVNDCLGTLGEAPLNSLLEPHEFRGTAQRLLLRASTRIQSPGWWFNTEEITFSPQGAEVVLPGDSLKFQTGTRTAKSKERVGHKPWIVERGGRLYNAQTQSFMIDEDVVGELVRLIPFDQLPTIVNELIAAEAVYQFQSSFDADRAKREELAEQVRKLTIQANAENIRQQAVNMLYNNPRLARIKRVTYRMR